MYYMLNFSDETGVELPDQTSVVGVLLQPCSLGNRQENILTLPLVSGFENYTLTHYFLYWYDEVICWPVI